MSEPGTVPLIKNPATAPVNQVENAERDRSRGLGLGLSIVQRLCGLLDLKLGMQSVPGQGTRFTLQFAAFEARPPSAAVAAATPVGFCAHRGEVRQMAYRRIWNRPLFRVETRCVTAGNSALLSPD